MTFYASVQIFESSPLYNSLKDTKKKFFLKNKKKKIKGNDDIKHLIPPAYIFLIDKEM